jgi:small subunit ribosomal protein S16
MLTIRLTRKGKKNQPFFRVVLVDKRQSSKSGKAVENLGFVDPLTKKKNFKKDRILYWISKGAKPSDTIHNWLVSEKIIDAKKNNVSKLSRKKKAKIEAEKKAEADAQAAARKSADEAEKLAKEAQEVKQETPAQEPSKPEEVKPEPQEAPAEEQKPEEKPAE